LRFLYPIWCWNAKIIPFSQGNDLGRAIDWLFSHPDDAGQDEAATSSSAVGAASPGGSTALPAGYRLKAFISHKGPSVHSGHYVAHIRVEGDQWIFFNDEKVVRTDSEGLEKLKPYAYLYVFERM
jgi:ubiquitin carboxyl-terminal hydrolase 5/13